ncbi:MAG: hypothetical protein CHACPFDD_03374 [Phycisphaerae bacterium]|nr:hypothetical protein [Phycisphaerae bacterium]
MNQSNILLTGATGLLGGELLPRLLARGHRVWTLVRPRNGRDPAARIAQRLARSGLHSARSATAVAGDVTQPGLGLSAADSGELRAELDLIIHAAAELSFTHEQKCRTTNLSGVQHVVDFARNCRRLVRIAYVGTAYSVGAVRNRCLGEDEAATAGGHWNAYTRTKAEAEETVRASGLPFLVLKPSIILSKGLHDRAFARTILWFIPLLNQMPALPVDPRSRLDIVPVGFVADAIADLATRRATAFDTYHVSAGEARSASCGEIGRVVDRYFGRTEALRLIAPEAWTGSTHREHVRTPSQRMTFHRMRPYLPFLNMNVVYDNQRLLAETGQAPAGIARMTEYLPSLLDLMGNPEPARRDSAAGQLVAI